MGAETCSQRSCPGAYRAQPADAAQGRRRAGGSFLRCMIDTRASVRRATPPSIWAATLSRRWPSGAVPNRVNYAQMRRLAAPG